MLKQRPNFLCQECHSGLQHVSQLAYSVGRAPGTGLPPAIANGGPVNGRECLNCHVNIHGSNSTQNAETAAHFRR
jgi:hypothetical protein